MCRDAKHNKDQSDGENVKIRSLLVFGLLLPILNLSTPVELFQYEAPGHNVIFNNGDGYDDIQVDSFITSPW